VRSVLVLVQVQLQSYHELVDKILAHLALPSPAAAVDDDDGDGGDGEESLTDEGLGQ
jgi:hypothetical protein